MLLGQHASRERVSVSPGRTGTAACATIGPESSSGTTKWTVQPWMRNAASKPAHAG
jgi:hypothetical protein